MNAFTPLINRATRHRIFGAAVGGPLREARQMREIPAAHALC
jgi:hypothetical protein